MKPNCLQEGRLPGALASSSTAHGIADRHRTLPSQPYDTMMVATQAS
jgi:hypothetical protein